MLDRRPRLAALLLGLATFALFALHLGRPGTIVFDEVHYVPAARAMLDFSMPMNSEHPPLAKQAIAIGMALFGDGPIGWRAMSVVAGVATVLGGFAILLLAFGRVPVALIGAVLVALNQMVFVQARIAMLDGFLGAFVTCGIAALVWAGQGRSFLRLALAAILFGAATATKWAAAPYVALACLAILWSLRARPATALAATFAFGTIAVATYFASFVPLFFHARDAFAPGDLIAQQWRMLDSQTQILRPHPYQSDWYSWPLMLRPIWYFYEPDAGVQRGVLLIGNPVVLWGGLASIVACGVAWWRGSKPHGALAGLWAFSLAIFAVIPKSLGFFYYYHLSSVFVALALAAAIYRYATPRAQLAVVGAAAIAFLWFYPILSGAALPDDQAFVRWMLFDGWR
jgi:dolichyl-phosphate-mannose-protein mannosyltransferase